MHFQNLVFLKNTYKMSLNYFKIVNSENVFIIRRKHFRVILKTVFMEKQVVDCIF